jgi:hypothetical protein
MLNSATRRPATPPCMPVGRISEHSEQGDPRPVARPRAGQPGSRPAIRPVSAPKLSNADW